MESGASSREKARSSHSSRQSSSQSDAQQRNVTPGPSRLAENSSTSRKPQKPSHKQNDHKPACEFFERTGTCRFGDKCRFSHDVGSTSKRKSSASSHPSSSHQAENKRNTQSSATGFKPVCSSFAGSGVCKYGEACRFSHDAEDIAKNKSSQAGASSDATPLPCAFFKKTGTCRFGEKCRFSHNVNSTSGRKSLASQPSSSHQAEKKRNTQSSATDFKPICNFFARTGTCKYGDNCRFSHNAKHVAKPRSRQSAGSSTVKSPQASMDVTQFIKRIESVVQKPNATLRLDHEYDIDLWKKSWTAVGVGAEMSSGNALLVMLMRLPASSLFLPPTSDMLRTLSRIGQYVAAANVSDKVRLKTFELIADVYEHRLRGREGTISASLRSSCVDKTSELRANMHAGLMKAIGNPVTAQRASNLLIRSLTLFDRFISDLDRREAVKEKQDVPSNEPDSWSGWRNATVGWLQRASWLKVTQLDKKYESVEHYAETLRALMTTLAFFWGAGALFPKCRVRNDGTNACDQPLHVQIHSSRSQLCGQKLANRQTCSEKATWRCVRYGHDSVCDRCLRRTQEALVGDPGPRASTDIYDAVVERETTRRDGVVYIASKLESRKPPAIAPNWKTTYRLNCSAMVGIVRLGASCAPLSAQSRVEWAEIVPVSPQEGPMNDFHERARGRIALRLLTRADLSTLSGTWEALRSGSRIAIIDLQVFVPEVVSVLSALTDPGLVDHLHHIQFWPQLIGTNRAGEIENPGSSVSDVVRFALDNTQMDLISRLEPSTKALLCQQITQLARQSNLSGTQLEAFAAALSNSLHCTQGPPGTGKSYLGVVLIRALDLIRNVAVRSGNAVGPIVVLSYKNHALDEILADLVDTRQWSGAIIRCGKTDDPRLAACMERKSPEERRAQAVLTERVATLRRTRRIMRDIRALSSAFADETGISLHSWISSLRSKETDDEAEISTRWVLQMLRFFLQKQGFDEDINSEQAYELLRDTMVPEPDMGVTSGHDFDLLAVLPGLGKDTEHWFEGQANRTYFLLSKWLAGSKPPPRCAADGCMLSTIRPGAFCAQVHGCLMKDCGNLRVNGLWFCGTHRCRYEGGLCKNPRMERVSMVCLDHACIYCREHKIVPLLPRIGAACENHSCRDDGCPEAFLAPTLPFCAKHCCRLCYDYAHSNPDNVRSVYRVEASQFCAEHKCSAQECDRNRDLRDTSQHYCVYHGCIECDGIRNVIDFTMPKSRLCTQHRCSSILDGQACGSRREGNSQFCSAHTCRFCREEGLSLDKNVVDSEPRNACNRHRLCENLTSSGETCNERVSSSKANYCEEHQRRGKGINNDRGAPGTVMQCEGITSKRRRCRTNGLSDRAPYYCGPHIAQKPDSESESETGEDFYSSDEADQSLEDEILDDIESNLEPLGKDIESKLPRPPNDTPATLVLDNTSVEAHSVNSNVKMDHDLLSGKPIARRHEVKNVMEPEDMKPALNTPTADDHNQRFSSHAEEQASTDPEAEANELDSQLRTEGSTHNGPQGDELLGDVTHGRSQDELDESSTDSELSEEEITDQMRHLRDIFDIDSASGSDSDVEESSEVPVCMDGRQDESLSAAPKDWHWDLPLFDRWRYVVSFLGIVLEDIAEVADIADTHVECSRRELSEAAAYSFKSARVIGATVIGATRRLHALRASEPFAMLVEEACEVLEPTLVSVLSVRSLRKLELIGDHRQLPAYVQSCWFSVQVANPSLKVSLFERLVLNDPSSCTVLDVQRRMRPFICDLTRCEYEDIVQIEDFATTKTQLIGDKLRDFNTHFRHREKWQSEERDLWVGKGTVVPGIKPQVFFWDLQTKEGRAAVGLSRCNYGEAEACVALAHWLVYCGVPPGSITIITPYKGQKLTITRHLRGVSDDRVKRVFVSTVDRYQGDENDIVILSLVSTRPGNRFVALRNRFIVSLSRARIGLYVVGSSDAVSRNAKGGEGPAHWCRLLSNLNDSVGTSSMLNKTAAEASESIGSRLSICCPRHNDISREITGADSFPIGASDFSEFCSKLCTFNLPWCSHTCGLQCHSSKEVKHRTRCSAVVERPCSAHVDIPLHCYEVRLKASKSNNLAGGLLEFECEVPVLFSRPECSHSVELKCHYYVQMKQGEVQLSDCSEEVDDYVNPSCGHKKRNPTCYNRRKWEKEPPSCRVLVSHERPCGCKTRMACEDSVEELSLENPPTCLEAVAKPRPRCSHILSSRCYEATALRQFWSEQDGEAISRSPPIVLHGVQYGPSETELGKVYSIRDDFPECLIKTSYRRSCGHMMKVRCEDAFQLSKGGAKEGFCHEKVPQVSPLCGHEIGTACHFKSIVDSQPPSLFVSRVNEKGEMETVADESAIEKAPPFNPRLKKLGALCGGSFAVQRKCGHKTNKLYCTELYSLFRTRLLPLCETKVELRMECGHSFTTLCHRRGEPYPDCKEPVENVFLYSSCKRLHSVRPGVCSELQRLRALESPQCPVLIRSNRSRCSHEVEVPCHLEKRVTTKLPGVRTSEADPVVKAGVDYSDPAVGIDPCNAPVTYRRLCGHEEANIPCNRAFEWAADPHLTPPCRVVVETLSPLCQHAINVECCMSEAVSSAIFWDDAPPPRITLAFDGRDDFTSPVVIKGTQEPNRVRDIQLPDCTFTTRLHKICGHEEDVKCNNIFGALESPCQQTDVVTCDECGNNAPVPCHKLGNESDPYLCQALVEKMCSTCDINYAKVECFRKTINCAREVCAELPCGHQMKWICGEEDPRQGFKIESCLFCMRESYIAALDDPQTIKATLPGPESSSAENENEGLSAQSCGLDSTLLLENLIKRSQSILSSCTITESEQVGPINEEALRSARTEMLKYQIDVLTNAVKNGEFSVEELEVERPPQLSDALNSYDIVYSVVSDKDSPADCFRLRDCQYGYGASVSVLCEEAVAADYTSSNASDGILVSIAAVLKVKGLKGKQPFRLPQGQLNKKGLRKVLQKARRRGLNFVQMGYDHVHPVGKPYGRVYWIADAIVPILKMKVQPMRTCGICFDDVLPVKGWCCPNEHFLCRECFNGHVEAAKAPDALARSVDGEGHVLCPQPECKEKFDGLHLVGQKHDASEEEMRELFDTLQQMRMQRHATREVQAALQQQKLQLESEFARIQMIEDGNERRAEMVRLEITDEILTLRCPAKTCRMAFVDFDGCFALQCSNIECRMPFCAWCLKHGNGADMHRHVCHCPERTAEGVFHSLRSFSTHHRRRRARLIGERLIKETSRVQKRVVELLHQELKDLRITIRM